MNAAAHAHDHQIPASGGALTRVALSATLHCLTARPHRSAEGDCGCVGCRQASALLNLDDQQSSDDARPDPQGLQKGLQKVEQARSKPVRAHESGPSMI